MATEIIPPPGNSTTAANSSETSGFVGEDPGPRMTSQGTGTPALTGTRSGIASAGYRLVESLASLKLTVTLLALSIALIFFGTLAQVDKDIWQVIHEYFRIWITWIDLRIFFPPSFVGHQWNQWSKKELSQYAGFPFPGGATIGSLMIVNLLAAHLIRFKVQAQGARLWSGLAVCTVGLFLTWLVIASTSNTEGIQTDPWISYAALWLIAKCGLTIAGLLSIYHTATLSAEASRNRLVYWGWTGFSVFKVLLCGWLWNPILPFTPSDSAMRIFWQLTQGSLSGVVLLIGCWLLFKQRAGVVLLHFGIGLMMLGEWYVAMYAVENRISLREGETTNYVYDFRTFEMAVIELGEGKTETVTVIPRSVLLGETGMAKYDAWRKLRESWDKTSREYPLVEHEQLPFQVQVVNFSQNAILRRLKGDEKPVADGGIGLLATIDPLAPGTGTDSEGRVDLPAAYVRFTSLDGKQVLGTRLLDSLMRGQPETIRVGEKTYEVGFRFKRTYRPYVVTLIDARKDDYIGTNTPRNYSSDIHLFDPNRKVDRSVHVWMNNPLRFAGETFYQSGYDKNEKTGVESSTISVVSNTGWMIPYISCMIVTIGLLSHFLTTLSRFVNRHAAAETSLSAEAVAMGNLASATDPRRKAAKKPASGSQGVPIDPPTIAWGVPAAVIGLSAVMLAYYSSPPKAKSAAFDYYAAGQIPIVMNGRTQPLDSLARNTLLATSGRDWFETEEGKVKKKQPAMRWMLDLISQSDDVHKHAIFKITNLELLGTLKLKPREHFYYAYAEFAEHVEMPASKAGREDREIDEKDMPQFLREVKTASLKSEKKEPLSLYDRDVMRLNKSMRIVGLVQRACVPPNLNFKNPERAFEFLRQGLQAAEFIKEKHPPLMVAPVEAGDEWQTLFGAVIHDVVELIRSQGAKETNPRVALWLELIKHYDKNEPEKFNEKVVAYLAELRKEAQPDGVLKEVNLTKTRFEAWFNHASPFLQIRFWYVVAFVCAAIGWIGSPKTWNRAAFGLMLLLFVVHTAALMGRIYISGRPPVTNLYSAAVFVGWGAVCLGLLLEWVYRNGFGNLIAAVGGCSTMTIAYYLGADGDTFVVLQAVLDTQFWLALHVTTVTLGYSTTYVAGLLGIFYVLTGLLTNRLDQKTGKDLNRMIYGILCFSLFFSFFGTVTGGLWADDSWGRFWGWDPKENGALIIVLWNALALHARWGGVVKDRGLAILAIAGNICVSWSFFGVNELGVGLHAYGFKEGMVESLAWFAASQLVLIGLGLIPKRHWRSFQS